MKPSINPHPTNDEARNHYPIVLVHGLTGWGRDEMLGFKYWGGIQDIEKDMKSHGYETYTAAVGPVSSNWDRAVELYAQIKGGRVDYGEAHSKKHGHARYGRTYPGLYPKWGEINPETSMIYKIHLIGHSLGGQTIRVLNQLLAQGDENERHATPKDELSPLFNGENKPWIHSILSIASPHDGSALTYKVKELIPHLQQIVTLAASATGSKDNPMYDFKLDQWGLKRLPNEPFDRYYQRVRNSSLWKTSKDTAEWDLKPEGAKELNDWVKAQPNVYYFSVSAEQTYKSILTGHQIPEPLMNPLFHPTSYFLGSYTQIGQGKVPINSAWWRNDGMVHTSSMDGPATDPIVSYNKDAQKGVWNHLGIMRSYDHIDLIGLGVRDMRAWYRALGKLLYSLSAQ
ncbi:lipase [Thermoflavimicrobium daqui]|uniref:triacylglycerol lipase n=1 Tax=Thermoflavimicrobium daqui TaxID=2137476 RepID=A0A364K6X4_9BACL|nr:lipase [Thermoflavimicrobium daqui]